MPLPKELFAFQYNLFLSQVNTLLDRDTQPFRMSAKEQSEI